MEAQRVKLNEANTVLELKNMLPNEQKSMRFKWNFGWIQSFLLRDWQPCLEDS